MRKQARSPVIVLLRGLQARRIWRDGCKGPRGMGVLAHCGRWRIVFVDKSVLAGYNSLWAVGYATVIHENIIDFECPGGGTGRRVRLRGVWGNPYRFKSGPGHHMIDILMLRQVRQRSRS